MPGLYLHTNLSSGAVLTAALYNAAHQNHINNAVPLQHDDYSVDVTQMRTEADPGEVGTESLATSTAGEFERLRFAIREIKGTAYWYQSPQQSLTSLIPSGTLMLFQQTTAPTGWTKQTTHNNKALRIVSGTASSGGTAPFTTIFGTGKTTGSYALTVADLPSHTHTIPDPGHNHGDPGHQHGGSTDQQGVHTHQMTNILFNDFGSGFGLSGTGNVGIGNKLTDPSVAHGHSFTTNLNSSNLAAAFTGISVTNPTGSNIAHTHTVGLDVQYVDLIIASKD